VAMRVSGRSSFIFMTTVDEQDHINLFCQARNAQTIRKKNARAREIARALLI